MNEPDPFVTYDAAYVLGALSPQDHGAFEAHLRGCAGCARSVRELAGMPGLLSQAPAVPGMREAEEPPGEMLPALLRRAAGERRRRMLRTVLPTAAVALAACLALLFVLVSPGIWGLGRGEENGEGEGGGRPPAVAMTPLAGYPVEASVSLADADWGTQVEMDCRYGGDQAGEYVLVAIRQDGRTEELARWSTVPDYTVSLSVGTALRRGDIETLEVRSTLGYPVLRLDVPGGSGGGDG